MKNLHAPDSLLNLIAFLKKKEKRELWLENQTKAFKRLAQIGTTRRKRRQSNAKTIDNAKDFGESLDIPKTISEKTSPAFSEYEERETANNFALSQIIFNSLKALGKAENFIFKKLEQLTDDSQQEELRTKFYQAGKALDADFIGPLAEAFEKARHGDVSGLRHEFSIYSDLLAKNHATLAFEPLQQQGFRVLFHRKAQPETVITKLIPDRTAHPDLEPALVYS